MMRRGLRSWATRCATTSRRRLVKPPPSAVLSTLSSSAILATSQPEGLSRVARMHTFSVPDEKPPILHPASDAPFTKLLAANRGEIATRICRAAVRGT
jgi:hypothetical protein